MKRRSHRVFSLETFAAMVSWLPRSQRLVWAMLSTMEMYKIAL